MSKKGFGKFMSFFASVEDVDDSSESNDSESGSVVEKAVHEPKVVSRIDIEPTGNGVFDTKFAEGLRNLIEENDLPGVDYLEFKEALKGLTALPEDARYSTVFNMLKIGDPSLTIGKLTDSIDFYIDLLSKEEQEFQSGMQIELQAKVISPTEEALSLLEENTSIVERIKELNDKMAENQNKSVDLKSSAAQAKVRIAQIDQNFTTTVGKIKAEFSEGKTKINTYVVSKNTGSNE